MSNKLGELYVVATPIGNLGDFSPRAVEILKQVDTIFAEDTRHSLPLLRHFGIHTPCSSLHEHNERDRVATFVSKWEQGLRLALISDAGTPLVSDPGFAIVRAALERGVRVIPVPGACAAVAALSAAGLPSDRFVFEGFLPPKTQQRKNYLEKLKRETRTLIFYEAPHRLLETLDDLADVLGGEREAVVAREITKLHETIRKARLNELRPWVANDANQQKGEIVLLVSGYSAPEAQDDGELTAILEVLMAELPLKQAAALAAKLTGKARNAVYDIALQLKGK